jgi:hypothetical protein
MAVRAALAAFAAAAAMAAVDAAAPPCGSPSCTASAGACPTDNAVDTLYPGQYPWAAAVPWSCVFSIADYAGATDDAKFAAAAAAAAAAGGGVVYLPPGDWHFADDLALPSRVVLRGAPTTAAAKAGTLPGPIRPASRIHCPLLAHKAVFNIDAGATNTGVVAVDSDGCAILLWPALTGSSPPGFSLKSYWATATGVAGSGGVRPTGRRTLRGWWTSRSRRTTTAAGRNARTGTSGSPTSSTGSCRWTSGAGGRGPATTSTTGPASSRTG